MFLYPPLIQINFNLLFVGFFEIIAFEKQVKLPQPDSIFPIPFIDIFAQFIPME